MDIFIQNVPSATNHVEFRVFLQDYLRKFDILAFDIIKKPGNNWSILTVADLDNGRRFLASYSGRGTPALTFRSSVLTCKRSNKKGQPEPLKVVALLHKEEELRSKQPKHNHTQHAAEPTLAFDTLMTGIWSFEDPGKPVFDQKYRDPRQGFVTFGRSALVVYLKSREYADFYWHCRIDIPYGILESTIPQIEAGKRGSITFTLKSPPKIYKIETTDDLHLYAGKTANNATPDFAQLAALSLSPRRQTRRLERLCALRETDTRSSALCMAYKLLFPKLSSLYQAWAFIKDFSVPDDCCWKTLAPPRKGQSVEYEVLVFENTLAAAQLDFATQFQIQALVLEGIISPRLMTALVPSILGMSQKHDSEIMALAVKKLGQQLEMPGPHLDHNDYGATALQSLIALNVADVEGAALTGHEMIKPKKKHHHLALTYKATVTPTGLLLRGPDWSVSNRVLRKYSKYTDHFMRVFCADEDGLSVFYDPRASQEQIYARFRKVFSEGIKVAGRKFEFLGFSHASLRYHQAWFMAPFEDHGGKMICARDVIQDLGDFSRIHCSAKCAARIGQAFSDTIFAVRVPSTAYVTESKDDIERNGRVFSDGCGTLSLDLLKRVWRALPPERRAKRPTVLQVRYRGAKGMISLDTTLSGEQLHVRKSMTKYVANEDWKDIELCGAGYRPLRLFLNHQFIKILEDLGIPAKNFLQVQDDARKELERIIRHPLNAASFLEYSHSGVCAKIPRLIELLHQIDLPFQGDRFLTDIVEVAAMASLRSMKYRARIPIEDGWVLYGVMDETNTLKEGEVYVTMHKQDDGGNSKRTMLVADRLIVTRAPALHPGDVQIVSAVQVPPDSPLRSLENCIVFSQQGSRDLPSQLSGGDLDGDQFHVIFDPRLIPNNTVPPADYSSAPAKDLGRPVEVDDIVDFFIEFMQMDRLGVISNKHKVRADRYPEGTKHEECIALAKLASDAVDFSKSGNPADLSQLPSGRDNYRPDFMAPGHALVINELGATELEELEREEIDDPDSLSKLDPDKSTIRYYRSEKVLGQLYRDIDEQKFFHQMKSDFNTMRNKWGGESLLQRVERYIDRETTMILWDHHRTFAEDIREYYEDNMIDIMDTLRPHRGKPLTELEVVSGNILGKKERASTRYINEANQEVRDRFDRDVGSIIRKITMNDEDWEEDGTAGAESLPRAIACFKVALETQNWENQVTLRSWKYIAAAVCLDQLCAYRGGHLGFNYTAQ